MILSSTTIGKVKNQEEAIKEANSANYSLTTGFYRSEEEAGWFFDHNEQPPVHGLVSNRLAR
jgi:hypothetical protein